MNFLRFLMAALKPSAFMMLGFLPFQHRDSRHHPFGRRPGHPAAAVPHEARGNAAPRDRGEGARRPDPHHAGPGGRRCGHGVG